MRRSIWLRLSLVLFACCWAAGCDKPPPPRMEGQPVNGNPVEGKIKTGNGKDKPAVK